MSAGLRAAIIAVREFPPTNGEEGKAELGVGPEKSQPGSQGQGAPLLRQGSDRVTARGRVKLGVVELIVNRLVRGSGGGRETPDVGEGTVKEPWEEGEVGNGGGVRGGSWVVQSVRPLAWRGRSGLDLSLRTPSEDAPRSRESQWTTGGFEIPGVATGLVSCVRRG